MLDKTLHIPISAEHHTMLKNLKAKRITAGFALMEGIEVLHNKYYPKVPFYQAKQMEVKKKKITKEEARKYQEKICSELSNEDYAVRVLGGWIGEDYKGVENIKYHGVFFYYNGSDLRGGTPKYRKLETIKKVLNNPVQTQYDIVTPKDPTVYGDFADDIAKLDPPELKI